MKSLNPNRIEKLVSEAGATFKKHTMEATRAILRNFISDEALKSINDILDRHHRRQIGLDDITRVAYVHGMSISQNGGESPYSRVIAFNAKNGHNYDNFHVKVMTEILLDVGYMTVVEKEDRKAKKCRTYSLDQSVKDKLKLNK